MTVEFRDLKEQYRQLKPELDHAMEEVLTSANFISGRQVRELEDQLAHYVGVPHCVTCANGTDALSMMLMAWDIGPGDAVFVPDFTFFATGEVVSFEGAHPVFVDVDPDTFNIDPQRLEEAIRQVLDQGKYTPKAIIAVDLFGLPADYPRLEEIARRYGLRLLEDGAQGFGGSIGERRAGSFGDGATTSFFPAKPLGCYGDGGAMFVRDQQVAEYLESVRVHGKGSFKYDNVRIGWNSRLDTLQAAVLQVKLAAFRERELEAVNQVAAWYTRLLGETVKTPRVPQGFGSSWAQYTITLRDAGQRERLQEGLRERGIPSMVYYPKPMHRQLAFAGLGYGDQAFPVTCRLCQQVLSLPMHPYLTLEQVEEICRAVQEICG